MANLYVLLNLEPFFIQSEALLGVFLYNIIFKILKVTKLLKKEKGI